MKKSILLAICMGLLTSCMSPTYRTKDKDGNVIHVMDSDGTVERAIELQLDSIVVVSTSTQKLYKPAGHFINDTVIHYSKYVNGMKYSGYVEYKIVNVKDLHRR